jgi:hypothetical protein
LLGSDFVAKELQVFRALPISDTLLSQNRCASSSKYSVPRNMIQVIVGVDDKGLCNKPSVLQLIEASGLSSSWCRLDLGVAGLGLTPRRRQRHGGAARESHPSGLESTSTSRMRLLDFFYLPKTPQMILGLRRLWVRPIRIEALFDMQHLPRGTPMDMLTHEFATRPALIRRAIDQHQVWIEESLGVLLAEAVILKCDISLVDAAIPQLLGNTDFRSNENVTRLFMEVVQSVEIPPSNAPLLQVDAVGRSVDLEEVLRGGESRQSYAFEWDDGPVAFRVRGISSPLIALAVSYHAGPDSICENTAQVLIFRRDAAKQVVKLLARLSKSDGQPKLHTHNSVTQPVSPCGWDQLVLDPSITSLLKDDFGSFFEREPWFRKMRLPFRRGYLLHGPPGNGKSTAIRAMLTSAGLTAYTLRLFDSRTESPAA